MRKCIINTMVILPPFVVLLMIAVRSYGEPNGAGLSEFLVSVAAMIYIAACFVSKRDGELVGKLALVGWSCTIGFGIYLSADNLLIKPSRLPAPVRFMAAEDNDQHDQHLSTEDYQEEDKSVTRTAWHPYVYWRRQPFTGKYINIDQFGRRHTWNKSDDDKTASTIFMFGGSTMWGTGSRDDYTVASFVSKKLSALGRHVHVSNFGESGYVNSQGLIALLLEIRRGNVPDVAVFYDGVNEVYSVNQNREAGLPYNEINRRREFAHGRGFLSDHVTPKTGVAQLSKDTVDLYFANLKIISVLAEKYDFQVLFYWQPISCIDKQLSTEEQEVVYRGREKSTELFQSVYRTLRAREKPAFFRDLSGIFSTDLSTRYIDHCHINEDGNAIVADAMTKDLALILQLSPHRSVQRPEPEQSTTRTSSRLLDPATKTLRK